MAALRLGGRHEAAAPIGPARVDLEFEHPVDRVVGKHDVGDLAEEMAHIIAAKCTIWSAKTVRTNTLR